MDNTRKESKANSASKRISINDPKPSLLGPKLSINKVAEVDPDHKKSSESHHHHTHHAHHHHGRKKDSHHKNSGQDHLPHHHHLHHHLRHHHHQHLDYGDEAHRLSFESHLLKDSSSPTGDNSGTGELSTKKSPLDSLHHNLKPSESDVLFLKRRILYPGIFEQESGSEVEDEESKRIRILPPATCKVDRVPPFVLKEGMKVERAREAHMRAKLLDPNPELMSCGTSTASSLSGDGSSSSSFIHFGGRPVDHKKKKQEGKKRKKSGVSKSQESSLRGDSRRKSSAKGKGHHEVKLTRIGKPQLANICEDREAWAKSHPHHKISSTAIRKAESKTVGTDLDSENDLAIHESVLSLNEVLSMLEQRSKKPLTLKEKYIGHKRVPGHPTCLDKSKGYPECLPAGEIVRNAVDTWKLWGIPENVPLTRVQLALLMKKMENHSNNDYVCLVYALPFTYPDFDPYDFKIVKYNQVGGRIHYTMSRYGALFISHGIVEYTSMLEFQTQSRIYDKLKTIPFFATYRAWKAFNIWFTKVRRQKIALRRNNLVDRLFTSRRPLRLMVLELCKMLEKVSTLSFLKMRHGEAYGLLEFTQLQMDYLTAITKRLRAFETVVIEMTSASCRATLNEEGFSPDKYDEEMEFYLEKLHIPIPDLEKGLPLIQDKAEEKNYPGQWLSFLQQRRKRQVCKRLSEFIRLVDYLVQRMYYKMLKNSMFTLVLEMQSRIQYIPESFEMDFGSQHFFEKIKRRINTHCGLPELSGNAEPIFDIGCSWNDVGLVFSPSIAEYIKGLRGILSCWRHAVISYQNVLSLPSFHPYTQPILNGYVDRRTCGNGPNPELVLDSDKDLEDLANLVELILQHGFHVADKYIKNFNVIRIFCVENQKQSLEVFRKENDALVFLKWLEKYYAQIEDLNQIEDLKNMGVFRVNNSILRAHAFPTIDRCLNVIRETIPIVGGKWANICDQKMRDSIKTIEEYPFTADEYVTYLLYLESMPDVVDNIEEDWDNCSELFELMDVYEIPPLDGDLDNFKQLHQTLLSLRGVWAAQEANKEKITNELIEKFKAEVDLMGERMAAAREVAEAQEVLSIESDPISMSLGLKEVLDTLLIDEERSKKIMEDQTKLRIEVTSFDELNQLILFVRARYQLWDAIVRWDEQKATWDETPYTELSPEMMEAEIEEFGEEMEQLEGSLPPNDVLLMLRQRVERVLQYWDHEEILGEGG